MAGIEQFANEEGHVFIVAGPRTDPYTICWYCGCLGGSAAAVRRCRHHHARARRR